MKAASSWPAPGVVRGTYPQQAAQAGQPRQPRPVGRAALERFADRAAAALPAARIDWPARRAALATRTGDPEDWLIEALLVAAAALAEASGHAPHRQQLLAARVLLDERLAEMATGEGKTAAIALAAAVAALARTPVHVVTANDYLAQRDAGALRPFFERLGLRVACVTQPMDAAARRAAYAADVTYCTAKELAFDYLRDGLGREEDLSPLEQRARRHSGAAGGAPVLRGLCMAILDEADTVLIDEARVPLVLAQAAGTPAETVFYTGALEVARGLAAPSDYQPVGDGRRFALTAAGRAKLARWPVAADPLLGHRVHREAAVELALVALHVLRRDHEYVVREGGVALVDETTGRAAAGRAWSSGLHQLVELKEQVAATRRHATVTQITFQQFFPRYLRLAGASGTLREARRELRALYGLDVLVIAPRVPSRVRHAPLTLVADSAALWPRVATEAETVARAGRAVLVGTESVAQTEALSAVMTRRGLPHRVLHARQDRDEGELVAAAGQPGCVTVATSMAGRGTDIACASGVLERGGLHVILCQLNASPRIDRQFAGRAGRQGQPGSVHRVAALDFPLLQRWWPAGWLRRLAGVGVPGIVASATVAWAQWRQSFTERNARVKLCRVAAAEERDLTFSRQVHHANS